MEQPKRRLAGLRSRRAGRRGTVLAPGGTANDFTYGNEVAWNYPGYAATGGGLSSVFSEPGYQQTVPDQSIFQGKRGIPDVAFPASDFVLYNSANAGFLGQQNAQYWNHWDIIGGTSLSTPCWTGLIAIADQMRGEPLGMIQPILYNLQGEGMHDITTGDNSLAGCRATRQGRAMISSPAGALRLPMCFCSRSFRPPTPSRPAVLIPSGTVNIEAVAILGVW